MPAVRRVLEDRLGRVRRLVVSESMFGEGDAYWCNGKEIAHFENESVIEVRLTKAVIRERRARLEADPRVELRPSGADWITVRFTSDADVTFVLGLVRAAVKAHRPPPGEHPKAPPTGRDLERRRRFH